MGALRPGETLCCCDQTLRNNTDTVTSSDLHIDFRAGIGGGLFAARPIRKGEIIASFDGEKHYWSASTREIPNTPPDFARDHCVQMGEGLSRDARGIARLANHSCDPNCGIHDLVHLMAMRDIHPGEEITWDYAMSEDSDWSMECRCGSPICRGWIRGYSWLPPDRRSAYTGYISEWLLRKERPFLGHATGPGPGVAEVAGELTLLRLPPSWPAQPAQRI